jgi:hypothetical protein
MSDGYDNLVTVLLIMGPGNKLLIDYLQRGTEDEMREEINNYKTLVYKKLNLILKNKYITKDEKIGLIIAIKNNVKVTRELVSIAKKEGKNEKLSNDFLDKLKKFLRFIENDLNDKRKNIPPSTILLDASVVTAAPIQATIATNQDNQDSFQNTSNVNDVQPIGFLQKIGGAVSRVVSNLLPRDSINSQSQASVPVARAVNFAVVDARPFSGDRSVPVARAVPFAPTNARPSESTASPRSRRSVPVASAAPLGGGAARSPSEGEGVQPYFEEN